MRLYDLLEKMALKCAKTGWGETVKIEFIGGSGTYDKKYWTPPSDGILTYIYDSNSEYDAVNYEPKKTGPRILSGSSGSKSCMMPVYKSERLYITDLSTRSYTFYFTPFA